MTQPLSFRETKTDDELLELFKAFCLAFQETTTGSDEAEQVDIDEFRDVMDDLQWRDMSIGFFLASGATPWQALDLASTARYKFQYWC